MMDCPEDKFPDILLKECIDCQTACKQRQVISRCISYCEHTNCKYLPGHYYDLLLKKCVKCADVCGSHPAECSLHCHTTTTRKLPVDVPSPSEDTKGLSVDSTILLYSLLALCIMLLLSSLSLALAVLVRSGKAKNSNQKPKEAKQKQGREVQTSPAAESSDTKTRTHLDQSEPKPLWSPGRGGCSGMRMRRPEGGGGAGQIQTDVPERVDGVSVQDVQRGDEELVGVLLLVSCQVTSVSPDQVEETERDAPGSGGHGRVLADFEGGFLKKYRAKYPEDPFISLQDRRGFWVSTQYGQLRSDLCEKAISIWESKDFFMELEPLPGGLEAVREMAQMENTDVFICTSPINHIQHCPYEKYAWVEQHLGQGFLEQVILTRDKTVISGDILIDDKPDILAPQPPPEETPLMGRRLEGRPEQQEAVRNSITQNPQRFTSSLQIPSSLLPPYSDRSGDEIIAEPRGNAHTNCKYLPGHYYDLLLKKCVKCADVCGSHPAECSLHCHTTTTRKLPVDVPSPSEDTKGLSVDSTILLYSLLALCIMLLLSSLSLALAVLVRSGKAKNSNQKPKEAKQKQGREQQRAQTLKPGPIWINQNQNLSGVQQQDEEAARRPVPPGAERPEGGGGAGQIQTDVPERVDGGGTPLRGGQRHKRRGCMRRGTRCTYLTDVQRGDEELVGVLLLVSCQVTSVSPDQVEETERDVRRPVA
ncbi:hypothetical protein F7725_013900 [Dissostichus mawsoni]|uniref:TACI cysteine-rich domain-containing protein n=1 Tax=Dissostichus mawsoni TaxID=36200 RepID=A0A7J5YUF4_DISMA|nr:hypothetical protein F7725_013900 [Dissostichus mawsoni]